MVNFRKAFNSINHSYIENCLKLYGFGESIQNGGKPLWKNILEQGVPQGDVISPYIFLLSVEILSIKINYTKQLIGVKYAKTEARSELFADDI